MVMNDGIISKEFKKGTKEMTPEKVLAAIEGGKKNE